MPYFENYREIDFTEKILTILKSFLKDGHVVGVAPGGGYEAQLSSRDFYNVMWKQRKGFAVVAKEAGVPIYPVFTENIKEAFINMESGMWTFSVSGIRI